MSFSSEILGGSVLTDLRDGAMLAITTYAVVDVP